MKKIIMTSVLQVFCIALVIVSIQAEVLGGVIGFGICTLLCIPTIIRYSIEYGEKKAWKKKMMFNKQIIIIKQYEIGNYRALAEPCI